MTHVDHSSLVPGDFARITVNKNHTSVSVWSHSRFTYGAITHELANGCVCLIVCVVHQGSTCYVVSKNCAGWTLTSYLTRIHA